MKRMQWTTITACVLAASVFVGVAMAAGNQGSQSNPLVTLSYLKEVTVPEILAQVDEKVDERVSEMESGGSASFQTVKVEKGKKMTLSEGTQLLFRTGTAACSTSLIDMTDGSSVSSLQSNHLYLATAEGQSIAASTACTVLVLGGYTLS